jgi:hypothetical protein
MANTVIAVRSSGTAAASPSLGVIANGEIALNFADGIIYYKTSSNTLGSIRTTQPAGLTTEVQFNDAGSFGSNANFTFNKTIATLNVKNINVSTNLIATTTNLTVSSITTGSGTGGIIAGANVVYSNVFVANSSGYIQFADGSRQYTANAGGSTGLANSGAVITVNSASQLYVSNSTVSTSNTTGALTVAGGVGVQGNIYATNINTLNDVIAGLSEGPALGGATNPIFAAIGNTNSYIQNYVINYSNTANASADWAAYPNNGNDASGWIDMGITSNNYSQAGYNTTGRNEGYLLMSAPSGSGTSGNLVIATDTTGSYNSIEFYANGFNQTKSTSAKLTITKQTTSTSNTTGAVLVVGGAGVKGNVYADTVFINNQLAATIGDAMAMAIALG